MGLNEIRSDVQELGVEEVLNYNNNWKSGT